MNRQGVGAVKGSDRAARVKGADTGETMADVALELESFFEDAIAFRREWIRAFDENRERRETAEVELHEARAELEGLLTTSRARGLKVATLARQAGVSRETAHKLLRRACE